jgi:thioredoxin reductase
VAERWGRSVFHCPFCHGWEVRDRALGVLGGGAGDVDRALLLRAWSDDVTLLAAEVDGEGAERLAAAGVALDARSVVGLRGDGETMVAVTFADGSERPCDALLVPITMHQRSALAERLGATIAEPGPVVADAVEVDAGFQTGVPGLFAAGDVSVQMPSVPTAIAAGGLAAAGIVRGLVT